MSAFERLRAASYHRTSWLLDLSPITRATAIVVLRRMHRPVSWHRSPVLAVCDAPADPDSRG